MVSPHNTVATCTGRDALRFCGSCVSHLVWARWGRVAERPDYGTRSALSVYRGIYIRIALQCILDAPRETYADLLWCCSAAVHPAAAAAAACRVLLDTPACWRRLGFQFEAGLRGGLS